MKQRLNRNYSNFDKKIRNLIYVQEHHAYDKNNAGHLNMRTFPQ